MCNMGLSHLTVEVLNHRELFEKNFPEIYSITKRELAAKLENEKIHDRIFGNWVIPLAAFRTLETVIDVPFSYADLFDISLRGLRNQNELAQESSEVADFGTCCKDSKLRASAWKRRITASVTCGVSALYPQKKIWSSRKHALSCI